MATVFASGLNFPFDVLPDSSGNVYTANLADGTISKVSPVGAVSQFGSGFGQPLALDFDASGNLFIASFGLNSGVIYKVAGVSEPGGGDASKGDVLKCRKGGSNGRDNAPGLDKPFNDNSKAPDNICKEK